METRSTGSNLVTLLVHGETETEYIMNNRTNKFLSLLLAITLVFASLGLAACGGQQKQEQDNCYGEDMPVINDN